MLREQGSALLEDDDFQLNGVGYQKIKEKVDDVDKSVDNYAENVDKLRQLELELENLHIRILTQKMRQFFMTSEMTIL